MKKLNELVNWFADKNKVIIALSGGVDSAVVAYAAFQALGNSAIAVTADYKTLSEEELSSAKQVCTEIGIEQIFLDYSELENEEFVKNDSNRCFHCRMELGEHLIEFEYLPISFTMGLIFSLSTSIILVSAYIITKKSKR